RNGPRKSAIGNRKSAIVLAVLFLAISSACRRDMQDQPKMKTLRSSTFFSDGLSARQPVEGTVPRGYLRTDTALFTGKKNKTLTNISAQPSATTAGPQPTAGANPQNAYPDDIETFPFPITKETVERGQQRYDIF